ncbi:MAG: cupin domain-containing protein [Hyphomicrobiales bacterium]
MSNSMEKMELNADFSKRAVVHAAELEWQASPMKGVDRRMLDRIGDEVARASSIVRYAPESHFSSHVHTGGEEFIVLDGVFQDEHGDFPKGSYVRNPPQSSHTPGSKPGCTIFVKLWQMEQSDRTHVRIDMNKMSSNQFVGRDNVRIMPLFNDGFEDVRLELWDANKSISYVPEGGLEVFVIEGGFDEGDESFREHSWLRLPVGSSLAANVGGEGAMVWIKEGHLAHMNRESFATL